MHSYRRAFAFSVVLTVTLSARTALSTGGYGLDMAWRHRSAASESGPVVETGSKYADYNPQVEALGQQVKSACASQSTGDGRAYVAGQAVETSTELLGRVRPQLDAVQKRIRLLSSVSAMKQEFQRWRDGEIGRRKSDLLVQGRYYEFKVSSPDARVIEDARQRVIQAQRRLASVPPVPGDAVFGRIAQEQLPAAMREYQQLAAVARRLDLYRSRSQGCLDTAAKPESLIPSRYTPEHQDADPTPKPTQQGDENAVPVRGMGAPSAADASAR